jgi:hypothetical protein
MKWTGLVERIGDSQNSFKLLVGDAEKRVHLEDLVIDMRIILKCLLKKRYMRLWIGFMWLGEVEWRSHFDTPVNIRGS